MKNIIGSLYYGKRGYGMRSCIYDNYSPCEECGRCKTRQEIIAEGEDNGDTDEDTFACHYDETEDKE